MKTLGRILIILAAFTIVMGITYVVTNAASAGSSSASANMPAFERGGEGFSPPDGGRPEFRDGGRPEFAGGWVFGFIKNIGMIAIVVALITVPKGLRKRKPAPVNAQ